VGAEIPDGAVIVARAIVNSSLWRMRPEDRVVAVTCLAIANKKPKKWFDGEKQIRIERGQFVRSRNQMAQECGMPIQVVRTSIDHLEETGFLTRKLTKAYTLYTLPKYHHYQDLTKYSDYGVRKLTQDLTRLQPSKTEKSNPEFPQSFHNGNDGNSTEPNELEKVSTMVLKKEAQNQPSKNGKTNHKQQQQTPTPPILSNPDRPERRTGDRRGDAVVVTPGREPDPILSKVCFRISSELLLSIGMSESCAHSFASSKPVGQVLRAVQHARLQKKPGGWARTALDSDWKLPEITGDELREIIEKVKLDVDKANAYFLRKAGESGVRSKLPARLPGEDERTWMRRVSDEIARRREESNASGSKKRKG